MAYGDLQTFLPRADTGSALDTERARAEGASRAQYLSSMDQFYEQLEESQRQFDIAQELAERQFEWTSAFEEKKLQQEYGLAERRVELEEMLGTRQADLLQEQIRAERERLNLEKTQSQWERGFAEKQFGFESTFKTAESQFLRDLYSEQQELEERRFQLEEDVLSKQYGLSSSGGTSVYEMLGGTIDLGVPKSAKYGSQTRLGGYDLYNKGKTSSKTTSLSSGSSSGKAFSFLS
jgi:hypothetical protein